MFISCLSLFLATAPIDFATSSLLSLSNPSQKMLRKVATEKEALLFEDLVRRVARRFPLDQTFSPFTSWDLNHLQLSEIPYSTQEEKELLLFLHWANMQELRIIQQPLRK